MYRSVGLVALLLVLLGSQLHHSKPLASNKRPLKYGDLNFLHTTDTHGWYSGHRNQKVYDADWGDFVSFGAHMREILAENGQDLLLVDTGDRHDGNGLSDLTSPNGKESMPIFMKQDYDLVTLGNHELYEWKNSIMEYEQVLSKFGEKYVSTNVLIKAHNGSLVPLGNRYRYFVTPVQEIRVLALSFLFDFNRFNNGTFVKPIATVIEESWFISLLEEYTDKVDVLVVFGHIPISHQWKELFVLHGKLRQYFPSIKIQYFGGHSHIRDFTVLDENSTALQSGRFCETVGFASINLTASSHGTVESMKQVFSRSYIDFNRESFEFHSGRSKKTPNGQKVSSQLQSLRQSLGLDSPRLGTIHNNYYMDYVPIDHPHSIFKLLSERVLPTLPGGEGKHSSRIIIINTGSVRYDMYKGPYTLDTRYTVSPFENDWVFVSVPRSIAVQIADKLNEKSYILGQSLLPAHHRFSSPTQKRQEIFTLPKRAGHLPKGYVTHDDFGSSGDDTPHKPVVNFPVPNVVQSVELKESENDSEVDVVFYNFIAPNVQWALGELGHSGAEVKYYSGIYLGELLDKFVQHNDL
ncbi:Uncharacterized protein JA9_000876 [Meyerozyma sp. JA9]|nr:Uncharacterized protein JA9_000876 [Meyerozyma sp. JA9]